MSRVLAGEPAVRVASPAVSSKRERIRELDAGRGLLMLLLVFRHAVAREFPAGNEWYVTAYHVMGWFHMPFFMFITGMVMAYSYKEPASWRDYLDVFRQRASRLLPAYLFFATIIFLGKTLTQAVTSVESPISAVSDYAMIFLAPKRSPFASYLWFLYVLTLYYAVFPLFMRLLPARRLLVVPLALALHFLPAPSWLALDLACEYFVFLVLGATAIQFRRPWESFIDRRGPTLAALFLASCVLVSLVEMPYLPTALLSLPALLYLCRQPAVRDSALLNLIGSHLFAIYLMNTIFINMGRIVILRYVSWDGANFPLVLLALMTLGLTGPILMQVFAFQRSPLLRKVMV